MAETTLSSVPSSYLFEHHPSFFPSIPLPLRAGTQEPHPTKELLVGNTSSWILHKRLLHPKEFIVRVSFIIKASISTCSVSLLNISTYMAVHNTNNVIPVFLKKWTIQKIKRKWWKEKQSSIISSLITITVQVSRKDFASNHCNHTVNKIYHLSYKGQSVFSWAFFLIHPKEWFEKKN